MNNGLFTLSWIQIKSALVSGLYTAVLAVLGYIFMVGNIFAISGHNLLNLAAISAIPAVISALKSFTTTEKGNALGLVQVVK